MKPAELEHHSLIQTAMQRQRLLPERRRVAVFIGLLVWLTRLTC